MKHGAEVAAFEKAFAQYVGAKYAVACTNGTVTMEVALRALRVGAGDRVATTPLTMASTSIAILNVGAIPIYRDVDPKTWLMRPLPEDRVLLPVELFGLQLKNGSLNYRDAKPRSFVYDGAQTLKRAVPYEGELGSSFRSYSFQRSKILNTGEGGMLVTDDEALALHARSIGSLGYDMRVDQPRIDPAVLKSPSYARHHQLMSMNARMNDLTAREGLRQLEKADTLLHDRGVCADLYATAFRGFEHLATPQFVPNGSTHDYWTYAVRLADGVAWGLLADAIERHGGERPYAAWRLTFDEPAFERIGEGRGNCPVARDLQPRLMQFQTNDRGAAAINAKALRTALHGLR